MHAFFVVGHAFFCGGVSRASISRGYQRSYITDVLGLWHIF
jgi:hypothetical protein